MRLKTCVGKTSTRYSSIASDSPDVSLRKMGRWMSVIKWKFYGNKWSLI